MYKTTGFKDERELGIRIRNWGLNEYGRDLIRVARCETWGELKGD